MGELKDNLIYLLKETHFQEFCDFMYGLGHCVDIEHNCNVCPFDSNNNVEKLIAELEGEEIK